MSKSNRSSAPRTRNRTQRGQQLSLGGLLLALLVAFITWWSGGGSTPTAQLATATAAPISEAVAAEGMTTPLPQLKVVSVAKPDTPTRKPTLAAATRKAAKATATPRPRATATRTRAPTPTVKPPPPTATPRHASGVTGLPTVRYDQLPREAQRTIELIDRGGPFPFYQDGAVFQNRERLLPRKERNYYREYTVITPGEDDRGARRIVAGDAGELFYTADHYDSFREVVR